MTTLISKVQYKNFEAGEFVDIQKRNYADTIKLIESFPWNSQRDKIVIDLTNPSITIEGNNNDFLKFALFFNQKYVLHYFDQTQILYTKSFINLNEGYEYIKNYFEQLVFNTTDFKKETTWLQHNLKHFVTQDFRYVVTPKSIRTYLISTSGINFCLSIVFLILFLSKGLNSINTIGIIAILLVIFLIGGGLHLIIFFNYYNYVKDKVLIMSRGNDIFYFGNADNPLKYDKKDILQFTTIRSRGSRNQFSGFAIIKIEFKNGTILKIPNLLVDYTALENKLFEYPKIDKNKLPYL
ncbi:hypothetical protein GALL_251640 [mine drainage metagenome]|uniref:PH domain-containing protein n=1 Tax=mine drainage metagenome TaxID=410659 RepID=A0A1J5RXK0_9ZZZZ